MPAAPSGGHRATGAPARRPTPASSTRTPWPKRAAPEVAADLLLDAAGRCFARQGVRSTSIGDVAAEAGCSRPTVYRSFPTRDDLRIAFIRREAERLGARIRARSKRRRSSKRWLVDAVMEVLREVRADPALAAWFTPDDVGTTLALSLGPALIAELASALLPSGPPDAGEQEPTDAARWTVRLILSLLATPEADERAERRLLERFLVPAIT